MLAVSIVIFSDPVFGINIKYNDFSDLSAFTLGGRVQELNTVPDDKMQLISGTWQRNGYAFLNNPIALGDTFSTHFSFQITNNIGGSADWLVFNIQTKNTVFGGNSVSVEFDIFNNGFRDHNDGNHIGLNLNHNFFSNVVQPVTTPFNNEEIWHAWIDYDGAYLNISSSMNIAKPIDPFISYGLDVASLLGTSDVYLGSHAASGAYGADFSVLNWTFNSPEPIPEPPTILLLCSGLVGLFRFRKRFMSKRFYMRKI
jgi:hypothetical protein